MTLDNFIALCLLAFAAAWTPGPNNALVASSAATFGFRRTLPHIFGIAIGFPLMIFLVGLVLGKLFDASPVFREGLRWFGAALLLWIAWKIATSGGLGKSSQNPRPFTFFEAAGFQWINPKGWAMAIAVTSQFVLPDDLLKTAFIVSLVFVACGLSSASGWAGFGKLLTRWVNNENRLKWFNRVMAAMIAACVVLLFMDT
ncbi:MAG: LysE family translocator [Paracoccaceae bacterium]|nr:LysE family translocator [Paracoccaceae bacterium]